VPRAALTRVPDAVWVALLALGAAAAGLAGAWLRRDAPTPESAALQTLLPIVAWSAALGIAGLVQRRIRTSLLGLSLLVAAVAATAVLALYVAWVESLVRYPADILRWSESPFVQDIIHFRTGQPLYGDPEAMASFEYPPLTQLATYALASLAGAPTSIPMYRLIQLLWLAAASGVAMLAVRELLLLAQRGRNDALARHGVVGGLFGAVFLFLVGTNPVTSPHAHTLHNDSLAVLVSTVAFWLLARFARTGRRGTLIALCVVPVVGFLVKQSLAIWAPMIAMALFLFGGDGALRRALVTGGVATALVLLANLVAPYLWGSGWSFWIFGVLATDRVSPLRSVLHVIQTWTFPALFVGAGLLLVQSARQRPLIVLWLLAFGFYLVEAYTSGIAWMLNHMAPGSLLAGIWGVAALLVVWPGVVTVTERGPGETLLAGSRSAAMAALAVLLLAGIGAVREPVPGLAPDAARFRQDIERSVDEVLADGRRVLLDHGSWVFLSRNLSVGDRSAAAGELGAAEKSDFGAFKARIASHYYDRILVRDLNDPEFFYDYHLWRRSSGIRTALLEHYEVIQVIPAARDMEGAFFRDVSVLEPRPRVGGPSPVP
jgi:hypothetical protein